MIINFDCSIGKVIKQQNLHSIRIDTVMCVSCACPYLSQALQSILRTISILCNRHTLKSHLQRTVFRGSINQNFNFHALQSLIGRIHCICTYSSQIKLLQILYLYLCINFQGGGITPIGAVSRAGTKVKIFDRLKMALIA